MLIEYRIKYENGGVTITQSVEPDGSLRVQTLKGTSAVASSKTQASGQATEHELGASLAEDTRAQRLANRAHVSSHSESGAGDPPKTGTGGGDPPKTGTGGGGPLSGLVIVLGPVVVNGYQGSDTQR